MDDPIIVPEYETPSELLYAHLSKFRMSQAELARRVGYTKKHINDVYKGKSSVSVDLAIALEMVFGTKASVWNTAQLNVDLDKRFRKKDDMKNIRKTHPLEVIYHYDNKKVLQRVQLQLFYRTVFQCRRIDRYRFVVASLPIYWEYNGEIVRNIHEIHRMLTKYVAWLGGITQVYVKEVIEEYNDGKIGRHYHVVTDDNTGSTSDSDV